MPEIALKALESHLHSVDTEKTVFASVYLLHGDEYLYKQALESLLDVLLPDAERGLRLTTVDGSEDNLQQALNELNTYSLLPGRKVVHISETRVFYSQKNKDALLGKAQSAAEAGKLKVAATALSAYLNLAGFTLEDVLPSGPGADTLRSQWGVDKAAGLEKLLDYCHSEGLTTDTGGGAELMAAAVEKGFPKDHHLILTTDLADKRRKLYKMLKETGVIVDCAVPKGVRFADKQAQEQVLRDQAQIILKSHQKTLGPQVFEHICTITGFELRTFSQNLDKLAAYVGERPEITLEDARKVLARTRSDPVFDLTNALFLRDADGALFYLQSMLKQELQPLQILGAVINQLRKIVLAKDFITTAGSGVWEPGMTFGRFKTTVMPLLQRYDQALATRLSEWSQTLRSNAAPSAKGKKRKGGKPADLKSDLVLAKTPQSAYPAYQLLLKADKFSLDALLSCLEMAQQADRRLKSSRLNPALIIEDLLIHVCRS
jgi:DNA polymerase III subunit delta